MADEAPPDLLAAVDAALEDVAAAAAAARNDGVAGDADDAEAGEGEGAEDAEAEDMDDEDVGEEEEEEEEAPALPTAPAAARFVPWEALDVCVRGAPLLKFGRAGEPHFREFQLSLDCRWLAWASQKKADDDSRVLLRGCSLAEGQQTDVFRRQHRPDLGDLCFSLVYDDPQRRGHLRTLDVACKDRRECEAWVAALSFLCTSSPPEGLLRARRATLWVDVVPIGSGRSGAGAASSSSRNTQALKKRIKDPNDV